MDIVHIAICGTAVEAGPSISSCPCEDTAPVAPPLNNKIIIAVITGEVGGTNLQASCISRIGREGGASR